MNKLKLTCKDFISVNHYMGYRAVGRRVMAYKPKETKGFEKRFGEYVKEEIKKQEWIKPNSGFIIMDATFYFPRIDMDCNNYWKVLLDILTTVNVWQDDNIVMEHVNRIYYDNKNPRIEIEIYPSETVGIFDSKEEYDTFKERCTSCTRFKRNCSIHNKTLESRIQEYIIKEEGKWECSKYKKFK
ncbi:RusA family crossover junction endodeoxyribonuclease [Clostridium sardiniense]|uniref:RusA family crossover junction endodeoxyribonuclease n=1 Tax=Clostridium sardiniense TaxID=29369 RepID=UPI001959C99D|nr:RusA family crossover junction endodeoxyribonuclease [Clostridium sardiniense]MBM7836349.1 Holliday junction resolvase RusA-like endonuclease [Clostridium sardiniense]